MYWIKDFFFFLNNEWSLYNTCFEIFEKKVYAEKYHDIEIIFKWNSLMWYYGRKPLE